MKDPVLKTKRLLIQPMTDAEIEALMAATDDDELRVAYGQMLSGCKKDPANRIWYAPWAMKLKKECTYIGDLGFKGPPRERAVEIGYGVLPAFEGNGYTTEAVQAMIRWCFENKNVVFLEAEAEADNRASLRILEKCGFIPDGEGQEGPRFVLERPVPIRVAVYMLFGLSISTALCASLGIIGMGTPIGLCIGLAIGAALDAIVKKERKKLRQRRKCRN